MLDCQQQTAHLASLGARPISREDFVAQVAVLVDRPAIDRWPERLIWLQAVSPDSSTGNADGTNA